MCYCVGLDLLLIFDAFIVVFMRYAVTKSLSRGLGT
jgi:hypothetical protein